MHLQPLRWLASVCVVGYYHSAYRIRGWGTLPQNPGPKLLLANHQHEIESSVIIADLNVRERIWRRPIFTVSSRRMWEPGFLAERIPWLSPLLRSANTGWLFAALGMQPIENELHARPFVSIAYSLVALHGDLPIETVFLPSARERLPSSVHTLPDLLSAKHFRIGRSHVKLNEVTEGYRRELLDLTRKQIEEDLAHFEVLQRSGAVIFLAPEGFYSGDGKMQRLRGALSRLAPLAEVWLAGVSYDPFVGRRLSMLYRIERSVDGVPLDMQLKRVRPVTVSALLGYWLHPNAERSFSRTEARDAVIKQLAELPPHLFLDPELRSSPGEMTDRALDGMLRLNVICRDGDAFRPSEKRLHPQFPRTTDIIAYQFNFHTETLEGARYAG